MPRDRVGFLMLRSTAARMGLEHSFSGLVDPSFEGQLTLELKNDLRTHSILITPGMRLVQLYVESVEGAVQHSYDRVGFYQGQAGPTPPQSQRSQYKDLRVLTQHVRLLFVNSQLDSFRLRRRPGKSGSSELVYERTPHGMFNPPKPH